MYSISFSQLSRAQKRDTILAECAVAAQPSRQIEVTLPPASVDDLLTALSSTPHHQLKNAYAEPSSLHIIAENWGADFDPKKISSEPLSLRVLAIVAILSEFTPGQGELVKEMLETAVRWRAAEKKNWERDVVLADTDVKKVIRDLMKPLRDEEDGDEEVKEELVDGLGVEGN